MILDQRTSSSNTKIKDRNNNNNNNVKYFTAKTLYLVIMCFLTNCLSSITLETSWRSSLRSISPTRSAAFNNLFRRNYSLSVKTMMADILTALVSTIMLAVGDVYGIPYLYLPWLISTFEGLVFHEMPTLFELAYTVLPNTSMPTGFFMFFTVIVYVEELCICSDVLMNFKRCWTNYNKHKLDVKSESKESCNESKINFDIPSNKLEDQQASSHDESNDAMKLCTRPIKSSLSLQNVCRRMSFTEVSG